MISRQADSLSKSQQTQRVHEYLCSAVYPSAVLYMRVILCEHNEYLKQAICFLGRYVQTSNSVRRTCLSAKTPALDRVRLSSAFGGTDLQ